MCISILTFSLLLFVLFIQEPLHERSTCELPAWTNDTNFASFLNGLDKDTIPTTTIDMITENIRYFAEECDYLTSIIITGDIYSGYGGLLCCILEELSQDCPNISLPIFAITDKPEHKLPEETSLYLTKKEYVDKLTLPLCHAKLCEHSRSTVIPISLYNIYSTFSFSSHPAHTTAHTISHTTPSLALYQASSALALIIHTLFTPSDIGYAADYEIVHPTSEERGQNYDRYPTSQSQHMESNSWDGSAMAVEDATSNVGASLHMQLNDLFDSATCQGKYPVCVLESSIQSPLCASSTSTGNGHNSDFLSTYFTDPTSRSYCLNPFTLPLSPVVKWRDETQQQQQQLMGQNNRSFSNNVVFRGSPFKSGMCTYILNVYLYHFHIYTHDVLHISLLTSSVYLLLYLCTYLSACYQA